MLHSNFHVSPRKVDKLLRLNYKLNLQVKCYQTLFIYCLVYYNFINMTIIASLIQSYQSYTFNDAITENRAANNKIHNKFVWLIFCFSHYAWKNVDWCFNGTSTQKGQFVGFMLERKVKFRCITWNPFLSRALECAFLLQNQIITIEQ